MFTAFWGILNKFLPCVLCRTIAGLKNSGFGLIFFLEPLQTDVLLLEEGEVEGYPSLPYPLASTPLVHRREDSQDSGHSPGSRSERFPFLSYLPCSRPALPELWAALPWPLWADRCQVTVPQSRPAMTTCGLPPAAQPPSRPLQPGKRPGRGRTGRQVTLPSPPYPLPCSFQHSPEFLVRAKKKFGVNFGPSKRGTTLYCFYVSLHF